MVFSQSEPKGLIFEPMGTCVDWYSYIIGTLHSCPDATQFFPGCLSMSASFSLSSPLLVPPSLGQLASDWRAGFFAEIHARFEKGEVEEDI